MRREGWGRARKGRDSHRYLEVWGVVGGETRWGRGDVVMKGGVVAGEAQKLATIASASSNPYSSKPYGSTWG